jgi:copper chaperone CopZ
MLAKIFLMFIFCASPSFRFLHAAETGTTTIEIKGMHCAVCAGKVSKSLQQVAGVAQAHADATKANAVITPATDAKLSPRLLWEAVEKAGYVPLKLTGPSGVFTSKP